MSTGTIFITASNADFKVANRFLLLIRDWEYGSGDRFHIKIDKNHVRFDANGYNNTVTDAGSLTADNFTNEWKGASLSDVETWMLEATRQDPTGDPSLWILLDDEGVEQQTCILAERRMPEDNYGMDPKPTFTLNKIRLSWEEVYSPWCNLDIANMSFDEFTADGPDAEGWWEYDSSSSSDLPDEKKQERDNEVQRLKEEGKA
ncbi:hypothetical protein CLAFUW4_14239 [Fulvia fulva]|uniref:Uncharacterized protein n=1 Tax=Passalora fulva TaxID=5499 RepID=A0A9Q8UWU4_PASFU|nr:uncharacterized protein CLAFUR5_14072 [Fulvia fulva]KAK4609226.1 hypothetical protein CLAFUR4_14242 [Fulvia fulva]KAK4609790.1 hypothetical protein CLAFUR0_14247 [Fulvia fulva]UJO25257.1 hypothetical protein CLAFUR5_14072 [Fulvia fulva]WPV22716.1 hypothetical protein CLAFUW4_14239 [Fulvia fulva]WPV37598.1 hypothetical protein CLAFUW7_14250 [Fulvia fulva]